MSIHAIVIGHLGGDAEQKQVNNKPLLKMSVAVNPRGKRDGGDDGPIWVSVDVWRDMSKVAPYLTKGKRVAVRGELTTWVDKNGGQRLQLRADDVELLGDAGGGNREHDRREHRRDPDPRSREEYASGGGMYGVEDDIPFASASIDAEPSGVAKVLRV